MMTAYLENIFTFLTALTCTTGFLNTNSLSDFVNDLNYDYYARTPTVRYVQPRKGFDRSNVYSFNSENKFNSENTDITDNREEGFPNERRRPMYNFLSFGNKIPQRMFYKRKPYFDYVNKYDSGFRKENELNDFIKRKLENQLYNLDKEEIMLESRKRIIINQLQNIDGTRKYDFRRNNYQFSFENDYLNNLNIPDNQLYSPKDFRDKTKFYSKISIEVEEEKPKLSKTNNFKNGKIYISLEDLGLPKKVNTLTANGNDFGGNGQFEPKMSTTDSNGFEDKEYLSILEQRPKSTPLNKNFFGNNKHFIQKQTKRPTKNGINLGKIEIFDSMKGQPKKVSANEYDLGNKGLFNYLEGLKSTFPNKIELENNRLFDSLEEQPKSTSTNKDFLNSGFKKGPLKNPTIHDVNFGNSGRFNFIKEQPKNSTANKRNFRNTKIFDYIKEQSEISKTNGIDFDNYQLSQHQPYNPTINNEFGNSGGLDSSKVPKSPNTNNNFELLDSLRVQPKGTVKNDNVFGNTKLFNYIQEQPKRLTSYDKNFVVENVYEHPELQKTNYNRFENGELDSLEGQPKIPGSSNNYFGNSERFDFLQDQPKSKTTDENVFRKFGLFNSVEERPKSPSGNNNFGNVKRFDLTQNQPKSFTTNSNGFRNSVAFDFLKEQLKSPTENNNFVNSEPFGSLQEKQKSPQKTKTINNNDNGEFYLETKPKTNMKKNDYLGGSHGDKLFKKFHEPNLFSFLESFF